MNWEKLTKNTGTSMRLVPPVIHLDSAGDTLPLRNEDWIVGSNGDDYLEISSNSGFRYRLGKDHFKNYTSDPDRSVGEARFGTLTLLVQLYTQGNRMWHTTTPMPGVAVPHLVDRAARARDHFAPEVARIIRSLVFTLDRAAVNFTQTSLGRGPCPGDNWKRVLPASASLYPSSPEIRDLSNRDAQSLSEFYVSLDEVRQTLRSWIGDHPLDDQNAWNFLAHRTEHALRLGAAIIERFCPDRSFDPNVPAAGTTLTRVDTSLNIIQQTRQAYIARMQKSHPQKLGPRPFLRPARPARRGP